MSFTDNQLRAWIAHPHKDPRSGRKINTTAKNGIYAKLQRAAYARGLFNKAGVSTTGSQSGHAIRVPVINPTIPVPTVKPTIPVPMVKPVVQHVVKPPMAKPMVQPTIPVPKPMVQPTIPVPMVKPVVQPVVQPHVVRPPMVKPVVKSQEELRPNGPITPMRSEELIIPEHTFANPFSSDCAKYYLYCGLDESEEEPGMVIIVNSNWAGLVDELWQQAHLLDSLVEHGIGIIEVPINMMDFKDFVPFTMLDGNEDPKHPLHYLDPQYQIPSVGQYLNKDYDMQEARMTIEYLAGLEEHFPDLGSLGNACHEELLQNMEKIMKPIMAERKNWEDKYLEYYTDEDWFYIDFLKMVDDLGIDDFAELAHKTFKKRVPEDWLAERYRDTEEIEEFLAHFECTIDDLYGSNINREGSDEYDERLNVIISEFHRIKKESR